MAIDETFESCVHCGEKHALYPLNAILAYCKAVKKVEFVRDGVVDLVRNIEYFSPLELESERIKFRAEIRQEMISILESASASLPKMTQENKE